MTGRWACRSPVSQTSHDLYHPRTLGSSPWLWQVIIPLVPCRGRLRRTNPPRCLFGHPIHRLAVSFSLPSMAINGCYRPPHPAIQPFQPPCSKQPRLACPSKGILPYPPLPVSFIAALATPYALAVSSYIVLVCPRFSGSANRPLDQIFHEHHSLQRAARIFVAPTFQECGQFAT